MRGLLAVALLTLTMTAADAADTPLGFSDPVRQQRYEALLEELRCLVCQNQSLADSHADLAQDMRVEVHRLVADGHSDEDVIAFLVERYGDFVRYRPPVRSTTWMLWAGPFALLGIAAVVVLRLGGRRDGGPAPLSDDERARLQALLDDERDGPA